MNWQEIALAIGLEALFVECCFHDWRLWRQEEGTPFNLDDYFAARASFAGRNIK